MRVGVFDSGIGGLNVLREIMKRFPNEEYLYFGDTKYLPYGEKNQDQLLKLGIRIIRFFEKKQVDYIIIACGTCSCLVEEYQKVTHIPIKDVITPTVDFVNKHYKKVVLLATLSTIQSKVFEKKLNQKGISVIPLACTTFVPYIEGLSKQLDLKKELMPLKNLSYDAVILGCTHYPLLKGQLQKEFTVPLLDMGKIMSESIILTESKPFIQIYMSKVTPFTKEKVKKILNMDVEIIEKELPV